MFATAGILTAPSDGTVLADSGALSLGGLLGCQILINTDTGISVRVERRNSTNTATVAAHTIANFGYNTTIPFDVTLSINERIRVVLDTDLSGGGSVQASIVG